MAVSCPHTFYIGIHNCQILSLVTSGLLPHVLKYIHKIHLHSTQLYGVLKNSEGGSEIIQISQKEKLFQSHIWGNLTLHHPSLTLLKKASFLQFVQLENVHGHLFEKTLLTCFSPLSPQAEQKENDEHYADHLQMYVTRIFTKAKKSAICAKYHSRAQNSIYPNGQW